MAKAYTPGLKVLAHARHRARRTLPITGEVRVEVGEHVHPQQVVAETFMPGEVTPSSHGLILRLVQRWLAGL